MAMRADTMAQQLTKQLDRTLNQDEEVETITEVFDTSLPADSLTGKPPLKSRTIEHRRSNSREREQQAESSEVQAGSEQVVRQQQEVQTTTDTAIEGDVRSEVEERYGMTWLQRTLCYIGIATLAVLLLWVAWRLLKRYLTII